MRDQHRRMIQSGREGVWNMTVMPIPTEVERVAKELNLPLDGLIQRGLQAFLRQEIRAVQMDISDLQDRYGVASVSELWKQIEKGEVHSHPAWEDSIEWEHLEAYLDRLGRMLGEDFDISQAFS